MSNILKSENAVFGDIEYTGLSTKKAERLISQYGKNTLEKGKKKSLLKLFFKQFCDVMIIILMASTVISLLLGDAVEACAIMAIVILNSILGFAQEYRTGKTMEALAALAAPRAKVIRDGAKTEISAEMLVPGDIVILETGNRVPADCVMLGGFGCSADEALLSGESDAVSKSQNDTLYMGTIIVTGKCTAKVTVTGMNTEMGKIAGMLKDIKEEQTPLQKKLAKLGQIVAGACLAVCAGVTLLGILKGESPYTMFVSGISLAVAAVPEGLPAIVTISLAIGVRRIAARNAIVRKLPAVETLGCATVICSDKTGTLTQNRMEVRKIYVANGTGLQSDFSALKGTMLPEICVTCSGAEYTANREFVGAPTETALYRMALSAGKYLKMKKLDEIPFTSESKKMTVLCEGEDGRRYIFVKGAPDRIIKLCRSIQTADGISPIGASERADIMRANDTMAGEALRVIAMAYKKVSPGTVRIKEDESGYIFAGLAGLIDPPRKEAAEAVRMCRSAGIKPVMITGDYKLTALAIAKDLDIFRSGDGVYTGEELDAILEGEDGSHRICEIVKDASVFARVTPKHKLSIVKAFRKNNEIVAMTGDGVNDAPAVKEAHIGVSMGRSGSDVTREASAISLMDDNFATLVRAVEEGRLIYRNILKFVKYMLSGNLGEVLTMVLAIALDLPLPLLPLQILLVNIVTDGLPAMALGFGPLYKGLMNAPPRRYGENIITAKMGIRIAIRGIMIGVFSVGMFYICLMRGCFIDQCRGAALSMLALSQLAFAFGCNRDGRKISLKDYFDNKMLIFASAASVAVLITAMFFKPVAIVFKLMPPPADMYLLILGLALTGIIL